MTAAETEGSNGGVIPAPFEFVLGERAVSQQTRATQSRNKWMQKVRSAASAHWTGESPVTEPVAVTITCFFAQDAFTKDVPDVDNIPKPILDALNGLVYSDDAQVFDLLCRKRNRGDDLRIPNPSVALLDCLGKSEDVVHVLVDEASSLEVSF